MNFNKVSTIVAYQYLKSLELQKYISEFEVYIQELEYQLNILNQDIKALKKDTEDIDNFLKEKFGLDISDFENIVLSQGNSSINTQNKNRKKKIKSNNDNTKKSIENLDLLYEQACKYLSKYNIDLNRDPILQILPKETLLKFIEDYEKNKGISWYLSDYLIIGIASAIGILIDLLIVKTPNKSVLTRKIKEISYFFHKNYGKRLEKRAYVPYDVSINRNFYNSQIPGLHPKVHRLMSLGHDPLAGIILGILDIYLYRATFFDKNGNLIYAFPTANNKENEISLLESFIRWFLHLLSDIGTKQGIPAPLFPFLQAVKAKSPFVLMENGEKLTWTDVARYMYTNGYDLRHFLTMSLVPMSVELIIRIYWYLSNWSINKNDIKVKQLKLNSMLILAHSLVMTGNIFKTKVFHNMNPLAINYSQIITVVFSSIQWIKEIINRDKLLKNRLLENWLKLHEEGIKINNSF